jgi:hypothetical protein
MTPILPTHFHTRQWLIPAHGIWGIHNITHQTKPCFLQKWQYSSNSSSSTNITAATSVLINDWWTLILVILITKHKKVLWKMQCNHHDQYKKHINTLNTQLYPICHLLALLGAHHILHVSRIRVNFKLKSNFHSFCIGTNHFQQENKDLWMRDFRLSVLMVGDTGNYNPLKQWHLSTPVHSVKSQTTSLKFLYRPTYLPTYITNPKEQSCSCKANMSSANQAITCILCNPDVYFHNYKSLPPVPILIPVNPAPSSTTHLKAILTLYSHLHQSLPSYILVQKSPPTLCMHPSSPPKSATISLFLIWSLEYYLVRSMYMSWSSSLHNLFHPTVMLSLLGPNTILSTLFSNTLSNVKEQLSHPHNTGISSLLCSLSFIFSESKDLCTSSSNSQKWSISHDKEL